jgi:hypothetical protein
MKKSEVKREEAIAALRKTESKIKYPKEKLTGLAILALIVCLVILLYPNGKNSGIEAMKRYNEAMDKGEFKEAKKIADDENLSIPEGELKRLKDVVSIEGL